MIVGACLRFVPGRALLSLLTRRLFHGTCLLALTCVSARAQEGDDGSSNKAEEAFASIDPYTKGEDAALEKLGYVSLGPFHVIAGQSSSEVTRDLGDIPMIWIETEHFKLGSSLGSYKPKGDAAEKKLLESELKQLKARLPAFKTTARELDPWLRAHLYAQRLENVYAKFCALTGFSDDQFPLPGAKDIHTRVPFMGRGPYLGQSDKFLVLLTAKKSTLGRFTQAAFALSYETSLRHWIEGGGMFYGCCAEAQKDYTDGLDIGLYCALAHGLTHNFLEGLRDSGYSAPMWLVEGLSHQAARAIDERWIVYGGGAENSQRPDDHYRWAPRVRALVEHKAYQPWQEMLAASKFEDIPSREHMIYWSRAEFLASKGPAVLRAYLMMVTEGGRPDPNVVAEEARNAQYLERRMRAQSEVLGQDCAACELEWTRFVLKTYPKK